MNLNAYEVSEIQSTLFRKKQSIPFLPTSWGTSGGQRCMHQYLSYPSEFYSEMLTNIIAQIVKGVCINMIIFEMEKRGYKVC